MIPVYVSFQELLNFIFLFALLIIYNYYISCLKDKKD